MGINDDNFDDFDDFDDFENFDDSEEFENFEDFKDELKNSIDPNDLYSRLFPEDGSIPEDAKLIESKTIERNGNKYLEEVWEFEGATITRVQIQLAEDSNEEEDDYSLEDYNNRLIEEMDKIKIQIKEAVQVENYELAAKLQSQLKSIENSIIKK